ncbi:hypothetical protein [Anaerotruncus colihominis]|uniref:hypothetical protein n=1 Tax=Anaerotruncus colihominis TaxID=169435 RepID=UPI00242A4E8D|nr:hypothetical protein [Anaerotruncus colihominis]
MRKEKAAAPKIPALRRLYEEKRGKEIAAERFAWVILERANAEGLSVYQLERACNSAISLCREALVPTLEVLQRDQES